MTLDEIDALIADTRTRLAPLEVPADERDSTMKDLEVGMYPGDQPDRYLKAGRKDFEQLKTERQPIVEQVKRARVAEQEMKDKESAWGQVKQFGRNLLAPHELDFPQAPTPVQAPTRSAPQVTNTPLKGLQSAPSSRFQVEDGEIIDTKNRQIISSDDFNRTANPQEKSDIEQQLRSGGYLEEPPVDFGLREDGTKKGKGYFGVLPSQDGKHDISTEISASSEINGKELFYPLINPKLTREELDHLLSGKPPTPEIREKAIAHALERQQAGKSPFAEEGEQGPLPAYQRQQLAAQASPRYPVPSPTDLAQPRGPNLFAPGITDRMARATPGDRPLDRYGDMEPLSLGQAFEESGKAFLRGAGHTGALAMKGIGILRHEIDQATVPESAGKLDDYSLFKAGVRASEITEKLFPGRDDLKDNFLLTTVPQALGSSVLFYGTGAMGAAARLAPGLSAAIPGTVVGMASMSEKADGVDPEKRRIGLFLGGLLGATEGVPIADLFRRMDTATGGTLKTALKVGTVQAIEEAIQEGVQQLGENVVATFLFEKVQGLTDDVAAGMGAGGLVGFLTGAVMARKARYGSTLQKEQIVNGVPGSPGLTPEQLGQPAPVKPSGPMANAPFAPPPKPKPPRQPAVDLSGIPGELQVAPAGTQRLIKKAAPPTAPTPEQIAPPLPPASVPSMEQPLPPPVARPSVTPEDVGPGAATTPAEEPILEVPEVQVSATPLTPEVTVEDIHALADAKGIPWDNDPAFMDLTQQITGQQHLDELDDQQRQALADALTKIDPATVKPQPAQTPEALPPVQPTQKPGTRAQEVTQQTVKVKGAEIQAYLNSLPQDEAKRAYARALVDGLKKGRLPPEPKNLLPHEIQAIQKGLMQAVASGKVKPSAVPTPDTLVDQAAHEAATSSTNAIPEPTELQKKAGNYQKGHVSIAGLDISIENPEGSTRSGTDKSGKPWSITMQDHYGYIRGTKGKDKDHIDVFIAPGTPQDYDGPIYVIDQVHPETRQFDEHKVILGARTLEAAKQIYKRNYAKDWKGMGEVSVIPNQDYFKRWLKEGNTKKPFAEHYNAQEAASSRGATPETIEYTVQSLRPGATPETITLPAKPAPSAEGDLAALKKLTDTALRTEAETRRKVAQQARDQKKDWNVIRPLDEQADRARTLQMEREHAAPITDEMLTKTVLSATALVENANARWEKIQKKGVTDQELKEAIAQEFGEFSGRSGYGDVRDIQVKGGKNPILTIEKGYEHERSYSGKSLLDLVRKVREIPYPETAKQPAAATSPTFDYTDQGKRPTTKQIMADWKKAGKPNDFNVAYGETDARFVRRAIGNGKVRWDDEGNGAGGVNRSEVVKALEAEGKPGVTPEQVLEPKTQAAYDAARAELAKLPETPEQVTVPAALPTTKNAPPERRRSVFMGKQGQRFIEFADPIHAEMFDFDSKMKKAVRGEKDFDVEHAMARIRRGLNLPADANVGALSNQYRTEVLDAARRIGEGETYKAPAPSTTMKPASIVAPTPNGQEVIDAIVDARKAFEQAKTYDEKAKWLKKAHKTVEDFLDATADKLPAGRIQDYRDRFKGITDKMEGTLALLKAEMTPEALATPPKKSATITPEEVPHAPATTASVGAVRPEPSTPESVGTPGPRASEGASSEAVSRPPESGGTQPVLPEPRRPSPERVGPSGTVGGKPRHGEGSRNVTSPPAVRKPATDEVAEEAEKANPGLHDYRITADDQLEAGGPKEKFKKNVAALRLLKQLEQEGRLATPDEQKVLIKYVGWGGIPQAFHSSWGEWGPQYKELEALLTDDEWSSAKASTINAHYTDPATISSIYAGLARLGVKSGRLLEPGLGTGNFFGLIPSTMRFRKVGVELDALTSRIAKQLYQHASVQHSGFEDLALPDNFFDVTVGNVPFADVKPFDKYDQELQKLRFSLHDYFFAKGMKKLRPGGIMAYITSRYTMDKQNDKVRAYLAKQADLIAAFRLPNTAFKGIANTEVVTDILFLQKREPGASVKGDPWLNSIDQPVGKETISINEYYRDHPENILGKPTTAGSMYRANEYTVQADRDLPSALAEAMKRLPANRYTAQKPTAAVKNTEMAKSLPAPGELKNHALTIQNGTLYQKQGDTLLPIADVGQTVLARIRGMIHLREITQEVLRTQLTEDIDTKEGKAVIEKAIATLNREYDKYVKRFEPLNAQANRLAFREDPDYPMLQALEHYDKQTKKASKADIFYKPTVAKRIAPTTAGSPKDALLIAMNETNTVDFTRMKELTGMTKPQLIEALRGQIYQLPDNTWEMADAYLSGNVRQKLRDAKASAKVDDAFLENVKALEQVIPEDLPPSKIDVRIGAGWVPVDVYEQFMQETVKSRPAIHYNATVAAYEVQWRRSPDDVANTKVYGTERKSAIVIFEDMLHSQRPAVYDRTDDGKRVLNEKETLAALTKSEELATAFQTWVWKDTDRATRLSRIYNDAYNNTILREYDGSHLTLPGSSPLIQLRPHQKNVVWRSLQSPTLYIAHVVGAGKTFAGAAIALEHRRLGLAKKPLFAVPNHLVAHWAEEIRKLYPAANVLMTTEQDFQKENRRKLLAKVATGNWDAVVIAHSAFSRIPVGLELYKEYMQKEIDALEEFRLQEAEASGKGSKIVKQIEKAKKRLEGKLKERIADQEKMADQTLFWDQLGVDMLVVDEADVYKNLYYPTRMTRIAGLPNSDSKRAFDMFLKTRYTYNINNGRGVVFMSGTPVSNTMAEAYTVQRYLQPDLLESNGLAHFDAWARQFGREVVGVEMGPTGKYRTNTRFAQFVNVPELTAQLRTVMDVKTNDDLKLDIPPIKSGKPLNITADAPPALTGYVDDLVKRAEAVKKRLVTPAQDNMLKICSDGRLAALDIRLKLPTEPDFAGSKVNRVIEGVVNIAKLTQELKGTQLIFLDLSTPKAKDKVSDEPEQETDDEDEAVTQEERKALSSVYQDMREKLVAQGIPANEVAFIHDAKKGPQKQRLFDRMNRGEIRVLIGSTEKMGAGMNVQQRLVALHHVDAPWRPRDLEQRDGRIVRQGNMFYAASKALAAGEPMPPHLKRHFTDEMLANPQALEYLKNFEVSIFRYATKKPSFDLYMWQTIESKARMISQVMSGDQSMRSVEDIDVTVLSAAEMKALAADDPLTMEKISVEGQVRKLSLLRNSHEDALFTMKRDLARIPQQIAAYEADLIRSKEYDAAVAPHPKEPFTITIEGEEYTDRKEAGKALRKLMENMPEKQDPVGIGTYRGLDLSMSTKTEHYVDERGEVSARKTGDIQAKVSPRATFAAYGTVRQDDLGAIQSLAGSVEQSIGASKSTIEPNIARLKTQEADLKNQIEKPFQYQEKLEAAEKRYKEILEALGKNESAAGAVEPETEKPKDTGEQAAGGEDQPSFQRRDDMITGEPTFYDFHVALQTARPIGGEDRLRLTDSSKQYPIGLIQQMANAPHVHQLVKAVDKAFAALQKALVGQHASYRNAVFAGLSPDDYYAGVNVNGKAWKTAGPDVVLINPWVIAWQLQKAMGAPGPYRPDASEADHLVATHLVDTLMHELTHQQVRTTHADERAVPFERQLEANYDTLGLDRLMRVVDALATDMIGGKTYGASSYTRLVRDLDAFTPFWRTGAKLPLKTRRRDASDRRAGDRANVAGEGTAGRTGPPKAVRSGRVGEAPAVGSGPVFQRRATDERVAPPQYLQEAQNYRLQRLAEERGFTATDPDIEVRVRAAKQGLKPESLWTRLKQHSEHVWHLVSREFEHLPDTAQFSPLRTDLLRLAKYKGIAADRVQRDLAAIIKPLSRKQYDQFEWKALLSDLAREAEQERALPFGYTPEKVQEDLDRLNEVIDRDPTVQAAWAKRQELWKTLKRDYQRAMDAIGFDTSKKLTKEDYFRHQVLEYARERALKGTGSKVRTPTGRGFLKARHGSGLDINANYVQAEFEVMAQMVYDTQVAKVVQGVDQHYNIRKQLESEAKARNAESVQELIDTGGLAGAMIEGTMKDFRNRIGMHMGMARKALDLPKGERISLAELAEIADDPDSPAHLSARGVFKAISERKAYVKDLLGSKFMTWERLVPETHDVWQPREGNVFYMADSIPAQMAKALQEGMLDASGLTAAKLRKVMAMGNPREQYVIPVEAKATLDDLSHKEHTWFVEMNRHLLGHWKQLMLIAPRKVLRYNLRNLTGDADAMFVGNPHAFTKLPQAAKDLIPVIFKDVSLAGEAKQWADRGGYGTTLQMQELGDLNDLKAFKATLERQSKGGLLSVPAKVWNAYWKSARLSTDYREAILRYAAYLDYLQQMQDSPKGRPKNFGASIPETVMALENLRDRAFKLSNELLGAYDRVSVAGQTIRSFWIPFWSWQEVNATRYARLAKNAFVGDGSGRLVRGAVVGTTKAAAFLVKMAMFWSMLQAWNYGMYGDDEDELRETNPTVANRPHILFGRDDQGKIRYLAGIGALGDFLAWFGLDEAPGLVGDVMHDRLTIGEALSNAVKSPIVKIIGGITPALKMPVELLSRQNFYPDPFHPRPIQDRGDYLGQQTTFGPEISAIRGKPGKPIYGGEDLAGLVIQKTDPKGAAYSTWQGIEKKYLDRMGKESPSLFWRSPRGEALSNWSRAIRDQDVKAEAHWKDEYERLEREKYGQKFSQTKMLADIEKSLRAKAPLAGVTKAERENILQQLDSQERRTLEKAEEYYTDTLLQVLPDVRRRSFTSKLQRQRWLTRSAPHELTP